MQPQSVLANRQLLQIHMASSLREVQLAQELDTASWPDGFKQYARLWRRDPSSLWVAVPAEEISEERPVTRIGSYVGVERIQWSALERMPFWDHDIDELFDPRGDVWYITGHAVHPAYRGSGLSRKIINYMKDVANVHPQINTIAVVRRERHPTLGRTNGFWERHGFSLLEGSYDPQWKAAPGAEDSGGDIFIYEAAQ